MGREVRMIKPGWEHPKDMTGRYKPLFPYKFYKGRLDNFLEVQKEKGLQAAIDECGQPPDINDYMPAWGKEEATLFCMYEDCSEGTPISPAFETIEELAHWLTDNKASAFGTITATYEQWLATCKMGFSLSAVVSNGKLMSGVEAAQLLED